MSRLRVPTSWPRASRARTRKVRRRRSGSTLVWKSQSRPSALSSLPWVRGRELRNLTRSSAKPRPLFPRPEDRYSQAPQARRLARLRARATEKCRVSEIIFSIRPLEAIQGTGSLCGCDKGTPIPASLCACRVQRSRARWRGLFPARSRRQSESLCPCAVQCTRLHGGARGVQGPGLRALRRRDRSTEEGAGCQNRCAASPPARTSGVPFARGARRRWSARRA